jgi:VanZ family protein
MSALGEEPVPVGAATAPHSEPAAIAAGWAVVAVWVAFIFALSGDQFSDVHTAAWLAEICGGLTIPSDVLAVGNVIVRKAAHFVEYAVLSVLALRAARATWPRARGGPLLSVAIVLAIACAGFDELRQYAASTARSGSLGDIAVDGAGAVVGGSWYRRRRA